MLRCGLSNYVCVGFLFPGSRFTQQSPSICSEPVPVGFSQKLAVLVLEGEVGGEVAVDVVGLDVVVDDGHLAGQDGGLEGVEGAVHQGNVVGLDGGADLQQLVIAGLELGLGLQAGVLELTLGRGVAGLRDLRLVAGGEEGQGGAYQEAVAGLVHGGVASVAYLELGQPVLPVDLYLLCGGVDRCLCGEDAGIGGHHLGVEFVVVGYVGHCGIFCRQQLHGDIPVHCPKGLQGVLPCCLVLCREGADVHPFHLHLVDFDDIGPALGEAFLHQGEELVGICHPGVQQLFLLIEPHQIQAEQLGLQQDVPALECVLHVKGLVLEFAGFAP